MKVLRHTTRQWLSLSLALAGCLSILWGAAIRLRPQLHRDDVLRIAYQFKNGGEYSVKESGAPTDVVFKGTTILKASKSTHCSGFTFAVAMAVAEERGLLRRADSSRIKRFQKDWYGTTQGTGIKTLVVAMERMGIGREIYPLEARPGDFVQFWCGKTGHSVIFLDWVRAADGKIIGLKFRSSQPATKGIGDRVQYFTTSGYSTGTILPEKFFVARLNP